MRRPPENFLYDIWQCLFSPGRSSGGLLLRSSGAVSGNGKVSRRSGSEVDNQRQNRIIARMNRLTTLLIVAMCGAGSLRAAPGDLYESDMTNNGLSVFRYSPDGTQSLVFENQVRNFGLAFDAQGNLFVADASNTNAVIIRVTPAGEIATFASGLQNPRGLAFDKSGNLFATEFITGRILRFTPAGIKSVFAGGLNGPQPIAFDSAGNLFVADSSNTGDGQISKFLPDGTRTTFASGFGGIQALAFDLKGNLFATDQQNGAILKFSPEGVQSQFADTPGGNPGGLAFDASGALFVTDWADRAIYRYAMNGTHSTFVSGIGIPLAIAFEPAAHQLLNISTRALVQTGDNAMIAGFIIDGHGLRYSSVVARAIGPSLSKSNVPNPLLDPMLELHNSAGEIVASNDNWQTSQKAQIAATGLAPTDNRESAILASLPSGAYTAVVRGAGETTGVALVEVYNLH